MNNLIPFGALVLADIHAEIRGGCRDQLCLAGFALLEYFIGAMTLMNSYKSVPSQRNVQILRIKVGG